MGSKEEARHEYNIDPIEQPAKGVYDAIHPRRRAHPIPGIGEEAIRVFNKPEHVLYDLKYLLPAASSDLRLKRIRNTSRSTLYATPHNVMACSSQTEGIDARSLQHHSATTAQHPQQWLITGVAGFIGSNLLEALLKLDQTVVGLDNFRPAISTTSTKCARSSRRSNGSGSGSSKATSAAWRIARTR